MNRRILISAVLGTAVAAGLSRNLIAGNNSQSAVVKKGLSLSAEQWREMLGDARYNILFNEATEYAWSSPLNKEKRDGTYICAACFQPLFLSATKFDSGTGWPSFYQPIKGAVGTKSDYKLLMRRTEYHCSRCGGHQGHVFNDGPRPTGQRWCNNGLALEFILKSDPLPKLRG